MVRVNGFWSALRTDGDCWVWTGEIHERGYGRYSLGNGKRVKAHRFAWEFFNGAIENKLTVDHLCRNKLCCNPWHMDLVPSGINVQRRWVREWTDETKCVRGHDRVSENTYVRPNGRKECLLCKRLVRSGVKA